LSGRDRLAVKNGKRLKKWQEKVLGTKSVYTTVSE